MKGMIFTEFLEMVEEHFSLAVADRIIEKTDPPSGGAYTAVGTYPHSELVSLVVTLSHEMNIPMPDLLRSFGERLFQRFSVKYAYLLRDATTTFAFLAQLETYVHVEVQKLYPEAELPRFECIQLADNRMQMIYQSHRAMGDLAHGLMLGCFRHFNEEIHIERHALAAGDGSAEQFILTLIGSRAATATPTAGRVATAV